MMKIISCLLISLITFFNVNGQDIFYVPDSVITKELVAKDFYNRRSKTFYTDTIETDENNVPINGETYYFPEYFFPKVDYSFEDLPNGLFSIKRNPKNERDYGALRWFSLRLYTFKEPLLFNKKVQKEIYRFTYFRSFHNPIVIRIEMENNICKIYYKVWDIYKDSFPGVIIIDDNKEININDWSKFQQFIKASNFWNRKDYGRPIMGIDGSEWIMEGVNPEEYKVITEWSPRIGNFRDACLFLLSLTDLEIKNLY